MPSGARDGCHSRSAALPLDALTVNLRFLPSRPGGLNADADVTVSDAVLGLRIIVGLDAPTSDLLQVGDLDADGQFTVGDVTKILQIIVGI